MGLRHALTTLKSHINKVERIAGNGIMLVHHVGSKY